MPNGSEIAVLLKSMEPTQEQKEAPLDGVTGGRVDTTRVPKVHTYRLIYDAHGKVVDYNDCYFRMTLEPLAAKLQRRTPEGWPFWVLEVPAGVQKPALDVECRHSQCRSMFHSVEERNAHEMVHHKAMWETMQRETERQQKDIELDLMRQQIKAQEAQTALLAQLLARGINVPTIAELEATITPNQEGAIARCNCGAEFGGPRAFQKLRHHQGVCKGG